eukprot:6198685-Pleurochrysis_carterae.AAC.3
MASFENSRPSGSLSLICRVSPLLSLRHSTQAGGSSAAASRHPEAAAAPLTPDERNAGTSIPASVRRASISDV